MSLMLCFFFGNAQKLTKNHTVKKGETVYQLSRIYNVSVNDIFQLNPEASNLIFVGEVLKIPVSEEQASNNQNTAPQNTTKGGNAFVYKVKRGDTKFGLSKKFGISISSLEDQNPHIKPMLQAGHILEINNSNYSPQSQTQNTSKPQSTQSSNTFHTVIKGDTFYGISKQYNVDLNLLTSINSSVIPEKMAIGSQIKIPNSDDSNSLANTRNKTEYLVKKGDTKFALSKMFDTSISELERLNPQIVDMLRYGTVIKIPSEDINTIAQTSSDKVLEEEENIKNTTDSNSTETPTDLAEQDIEPNPNDPDNIVLKDTTELAKNTIDQDSISPNNPAININENEQLAYKPYVIEPKETLYGLSKKAGMTIPEFLKLNPELSESVTIGTIIKMPIKNLDTTSVELSPNLNNNSSDNSYKDLSSIVTSKTNKKILMLMPFSNEEFKYYDKNTTNFNAIADTDLQNDIQFYRGAKTAIDSLNKLGLKAEISLEKISNGIENIDINSFDAIIASKIDEDLETALSTTLNSDIPIITTNSETYDYQIETIYQALPTTEIQIEKTLEYLNESNGNIIVISDVNRLESRLLIKKFSPNAKIFITNTDNEFSENDLISNLEKNKTNYVVIDSEKNGVFLSSTTVLLGQSSKFEIQIAVLESALVPKGQQISSKRFKILKLIYPDLSQITNNSKTLRYFNNYKLKNDTDPSNKVLQGFDIMFDTMLRLSQDVSFQETAKIYKTEYFTLKFNYKKNNSGVFDNHEIIIREFNNLEIGN